MKRDGGSIYRDRVAHPVINPAVMSIAVSRAMWVFLTSTQLRTHISPFSLFSGDYGFKASEFTNGKPSGASLFFKMRATKTLH